MGNRPRRRGLDGRRLAPLRPVPSAAPCGCRRLAVIDIDAVCEDCGERVRDRVVLPSSGQSGDTREVGASCVCGGDAAGRGTIVEVLDA